MVEIIRLKYDPDVHTATCGVEVLEDRFGKARKARSHASFARP